MPARDDNFNFFCMTSVFLFWGVIQYELLGTLVVSFCIKPLSHHWDSSSRGIYLQQIIHLNNWRAPSWSQYFLINMFNKPLLPGNKCNCSCAVKEEFQEKKLKQKCLEVWNSHRPPNVTMFINEKTLGHPTSGEEWCETNTNTVFCSSESKLNTCFSHCEPGSQSMINKIITSNHSYWLLILEMWVHTHDQRFGLKAERGCCCFTAGNPLSAKIKVLLH